MLARLSDRKEGPGNQGSVREREGESQIATEMWKTILQEQTVSDVGKCGARIGLERGEKKEREGV